MLEKGVSHIAYFRLDGGSSKLYTQEYVDGKDKEIERLNNIINKVREYIKEHIRIDDEYPNYMEMLLEEYKELLEILDKVGDEV